MARMFPSLLRSWGCRLPYSIPRTASPKSAAARPLLFMLLAAPVNGFTVAIAVVVVVALTVLLLAVTVEIFVEVTNWCNVRSYRYDE